MPSSTLAWTILFLVPCTSSRFVDPIVVPTSLLHRRGIDQSTLLENGKAAQRLNAKFSTLDSNSTCQTGDMACIAGGFSQCVSGKFVGGPCASGLKCFAMPLLLKKGTTLGCDTEADATTRISNTGATGGLTGNNDATPSNSTQTSPAPASQGVDGTQADSPDADEDGASREMSDNASAGTSRNATVMESSSGPANSSDASAEPETEKMDDSNYPEADKKPASSCRRKSKHETTTSSSSSKPIQPPVGQTNSTSSGAKPRAVAEVVDLDEMNITGP